MTANCCANSVSQVIKTVYFYSHLFCSAELWNSDRYRASCWMSDVHARDILTQTYSISVCSRVLLPRNMSRRKTAVNTSLSSPSALDCFDKLRWLFLDAAAKCGYRRMWRWHSQSRTICLLRCWAHIPRCSVDEVFCHVPLHQGATSEARRRNCSFPWSTGLWANHPTTNEASCPGFSAMLSARTWANTPHDGAAQISGSGWSPHQPGVLQVNQFQQPHLRLMVY